MFLQVPCYDLKKFIVINTHDWYKIISITLPMSIRGGMNSKGAHEFGPKKRFSLIFCLQNPNEDEARLKGTRIKTTELLIH